jgi:hypothetical protein
MTNPLKIFGIEPTQFFIRSQGDTLQQLVRLSLKNDGSEVEAALFIHTDGIEEQLSLGAIPPGITQHKIYLPELLKPASVRFSLWVTTTLQDEREVAWQTMKHWEVHLVHGSHHDLGYTDIPSNILREHDGYMDRVLKFCEETADWPEESKFRYVAEQAWSVLHYIEHRPLKAVKRLIRLMREGRIEVTAFLDNETSELCSHEEQVRLAYPAFRLKRRFGIPIRTAELNDIPGVSWGLVSVLTGCGVRYFAPAIQDYFAWGFKVHPHWDEQAILPRDMIGAFWWEGPDGDRVLFWYGGDKIEGPWLWTYQQSERDLPKYLTDLDQRGYTPDLVRLKFHGGKRDNSPPDIRISLIAREWNSRWAYPKLIVSTNAHFFERFEKEEGSHLRVLRGDLPNTDYPIGAISRAREVGINRLTHDMLTSAEKLAACAATVSDYEYPSETLAEAYVCTLFHDGHVGGMAHPLGPPQEAAWAQKSEYAYRASALSHDILIKSTNRIADQVRLDCEGYHIVVFNSLVQERTDVVHLLVTPPTPCSRPMYWRDPASGEKDFRELASSPAIGRRIINLPAEILERPFELVDLSTDKRVPYQVITLSDPLAARPLAAHRWALGQIEQQDQTILYYDQGHLLDLVFVAEDVPPLGYKVYRIAPTDQQPTFASSLRIGENWLENRFYRIELDPVNGAIVSIFDKSLQREWVDRQAPHGFNQLLVRSPRNGDISLPNHSLIKPAEIGSVMATLIVKGDALGCPQLTQEISLYEDIKRIDFANRLLKDATPLLELYFAFPFAVQQPKFRYEASNSVIEPIRDQLPGTNTDAYTMQHWVAVWDDDGGVTWTSLEAPVMEVGDLWPGYVSQAHHGITPPGYGHEFLRDPAQLVKGYIYSYIMNNNFRTNFEPVQVADALFRYSMTSHEGDWRKGEARDFGWSVATPLEPVCIKGPQDGFLGKATNFCQLDLNNVLLLTMKIAEDGDGLILRLAETEGRDSIVTVVLPYFEITQAFKTNLVEENQGVLSYDRHSFQVSMRANGIATVRCRCFRTWSSINTFAWF